MKFSCVARAVCFLGFVACFSQAFAPPLYSVKPTNMELQASKSINHESTTIHRNRRQVLLTTAGSFLAGILLSSDAANAAMTPSTESLLADLQLSLDKLKPIPTLLEKQEWDAVRTILKKPPVNALWNLGDAKNPILALARSTEEMELIDLKDELSLSLQMCDQLTYDNVFVYYQPGNGKIKLKEPVELAEKAMKQLSEAIDMAKSATN